MALDKNLNIPPYFDDYDENKRFHRIIHRPHTAVQARELTQAQSILQNQIERFGSHMFKDGSIVDGVGILYYPNTHYISLEDTFNLDANVFPTEYDSTYLLTNSTDSNNTVRAVIKIAKDGVKTAAPETNRFYLDYISTGTDLSNNDVNIFEPGETLYIYNSNQSKFGTLDANNLVNSVNTLESNGTFTSNGYAYLIGCTDGTIFQKGFFVKVEKQTITVRDFSTNVAGYVVGFNTVEELVNENEDSSLLDNALGYDNENAPGAHRLKLTPTLVAKDRANTTSNTLFFAIAEFDGQQPTQQKDTSDYNLLSKELAKRTYEESGDYVIYPFQIETRVNEANSQTFLYEISSGVGYIRGNRIEKIGTTKLESPRAIDTEVAQNLIISANYGNYVICDEYLGAFDFKLLSEVSLYNEPQNAISDYEGISSSPSGTEVGKANIRAVVFETGTKGSPTAQYLVYLFNIRMNSGKSFAQDVKSLYTNGSFGKAKADLVLENGLSVLKESAKNTLMFNTGLRAVKRLTDNTGIGDTTFIYNQIKSGTLTGAGQVSITIDTAASGASEERLLSTSGSNLTGAAVEPYNVYLTSNAYTANLTGNVAISSGNNILIGTSTLWNTELTSNNLIRITANSSQSYIRRIVSIVSNTSLVLDVSVPQSNSSTKIQKYYVTGSPLPLANVGINTNTTFTAYLGETLDSGSQSVYLTYPIYRNQTISIPKVINKNVFVKIDCSNNTANSVGPWDLGFVDVLKIRNVYVGTTYANSNPERSNWFTLDTGHRNEQYNHAQLVVKPQFISQITGSTKMLVELDYFTANTAASVGFFSIDSYPIDDSNISNTSGILTTDLINYNSLDLRNYIDFRPMVYNTSNSSTTVAGATINPSGNNTLTVNSIGQYIISPDTVFTADYEYYLPRFDLITLDSTGNFIINRGISATTPKVPFIENDQSVIAEVYIPPYPSATKREFDLQNKLEQIKINLKTNRRWTMKDIGSLNERIKRLEYYIVLSALEQQARDLTIPDANGLDRFKNGIFADPFNSHNIGNINDFEYKIAIDSLLSIARPFFNKHDIDYQYNASNSVNVQKTGPYITLSFDNESYIEQRYATKIRVACESVWQWNGKLDLYPSYDFHRNEDISPNVNVNLDLSTPWEQFASSAFGMSFGDWRTNSTQISSIIDWNAVNSQGEWEIVTETLTRASQERLVTELNVDASTQNIDLGSYVKDISIQPYMASRLVAFVAYNMKPNTTLHAFFDNINVDEFCAPGTLSGLSELQSGIEDRIVDRTGNYGEDLISDSTGFICGIFRIPEQMFRTGDRTFLLTNVEDLVTGNDAKITQSTARYTADNISVTRSSTTINVRQPELSFVESAEFQEVIIDRQVSSISREQWLNEDPIAQSFKIENLPSLTTGIFLTEIGVFFNSKDNILGCSLLICEMNNGFPNKNSIVGSGYLPANDINISTDATVETVFTLNYPVYLLSDTEYAFIIKPDGNSPEYTLWVGETGGFDIVSGEQVYSNPYSGLMFISANIRTWTAIQKEDLKFKLYRAKFNQTSGIAVFNNENDEYISIDGFTRPNNALTVSVGDIVYSVNSSANTANVANLVAHTLTSGPSGRIQYVNEANGEIWLDSSNGGFSNSTNPTIAIFRPGDTSNVSTVNTSSIVAYTNISNVNNLTYHAVVPAFGILQPSRTSLSYQYKGTTTNNIRDTQFQFVINNNEFEYNDNERHIMSRSNEINNLSSNKSSVFNINLSTDSNYVSPVINLSKKTSLFIENLINNDTTNEHTRYGNAMTKYVSKKIVLADGQEAEDLKVYITAYRPSGTDVKLYAKFYNSQDSESFNDKVWTEMQYDIGGDLVYSSPSNTKDYIEYEFSVPSTNSVDYAAFSNTGVDIYTALGGGVTINSDSNVIQARQFTFNANTQVNGTAETIAIAAANTYFSVEDAVTYTVASGNTAVSGLTSATKYYVSFANATHLALASTRTGANINLTASTISETGHILTGTYFNEDFDVGTRIRVVDGNYFAVRTIVSISNNTYMTVDKGLEQSNSAALYYVFEQTPGDGIVEYYNTSDSRFIGFKEFAIKIVLLSSNPVIVPRLNDVRAVALQV
jgi:hypothetical protein